MRLNDGEDQSLGSQSLRNAFFSKTGIPISSVVSAQLSHSITIARVTKANGGTIVRNVDGLITNERELYLTVTAADCLPVMFLSQDPRAIALVHAGWRGLRDGILSNLVTTFQKEFRVAAESLLAEIGPGICVDHYRFPEAATVFKSIPQSYKEYSDGLHLSLQVLARQQLLSAGIPPDCITASADCTYENAARYFSYRRDHSAVLSANLYGISLRRA